ncbi:MAG: ATP-binding cassette domain-containing protein [Chthoniobacterales bacterium]|nr:ATP-binding cassette domain-containing protein [Chthoniobacterales bacterium]
MPTLASAAPALSTAELTHRYGARVAIDRVSLQVAPREIFGLLGPNGGGKTTLFRILSTLVRPGGGSASILGLDLLRDSGALRRRIGVVFQAPSLDGKLRVRENLAHQGHLYGLSGATLRERIDHLLIEFSLRDRARDLVETLSGGLQRRVEIAKSLLHRPELLLLDEPSTGLDPGARIDLWQTLYRLRDQQDVTVLLTTHLMEEAERCDRVAIIDQGKIVALDTPDALRAEIGGDVISARTRDATSLGERIAQSLGVEVSVLNDEVRIEQPDGGRFIARLVEAFPGELDSVTLAKPTLEDVFIARTGRRLSEGASDRNVALP